MMGLLLSLGAFVAGSQAISFENAAKSCDSNVHLSGNPFTTRNLHPNSIYRSQVLGAAVAITDPSLKAKALKVADIGTFLWLNSTTQLSRLEEELQTLPCSDILGVVVSNLPVQQPCDTLEPWNIAQYKFRFIDPLAAIIKKYPKAAVAAIIEPVALTSLIQNSTCSTTPLDVHESVIYALNQLNSPNIQTYLDAGNGNELCWDQYRQPTADLIAHLFTTASKPTQFRGFATNVRNYNGWATSPGEFAAADDAKGNRCGNEKQYVSLLSQALSKLTTPGFAIVDTSRNGVLGVRLQAGDWCNVVGAGFGVRPSVDTGDERTDAFVWVGNGGVSDGGDIGVEDCGKVDAFKPSPERGAWNQGYFEMLVENAVPLLWNWEVGL